jgi:hypothetical protein
MWNAIPSDTTQRAMLLAALDAAEKEEFKTRSRARSDIKWIIKKANELAGKRNAAVHAPYQMERVKPFNLTTMQQFGNRLAKKLENKDLLTEFKWYSATADELHFFSLKILHALVFSHETWPDRPQLPRLDQFQTPKHKIHKKHSKQSQPPHGSLLH